jgi:hypothetical protein
VAVGERFRLVYTLNARPASFEAPGFEGFRLVSGPSQSSSSSTQIINNQVSTTFTVSYTYILEAVQEGRFRLSPATAMMDGDRIRSEAIVIEVSGQYDPGEPPSGQPGSSVSPPPQRAGERDLFVRAEVSNRSPFQSQQVLVTYKLYTRIPVSRYSVERLPSYQGFWSETLSAPSQPPTTTETIEGLTYTVAEIRRVALFPQRAGELTIDPLEVECLVRLPSGQRRGSLLDEFFSGTPFDSFQSVPQNIRSNAVRLQVRPLPSRDRPSAFLGLVGQLDLNARLDARELKVNEAASLSVTLSGSGNLRMLDEPLVQLPPGLEGFDPQIKEDITNGPGGISGSRTFEYLIIPREPGEFEIPAFQAGFFDPVNERYVVRRAGPFRIQVSGSPGTPVAVSDPSDRMLGTDIRFIRHHGFRLSPKGDVFFLSRGFWMAVALPFLLFVFMMAYWRHRIRLRSNLALARNRRAERLARRRLSQAKRFMKQGIQDGFHDEIGRALWGYLSDKLTIPGSSLTKDSVLAGLQHRGVSPELAGSSLRAIERCEFARFAPGEKGVQLEETYRLALETIVKLEKEISKKPWKR